MCQSKGLYFKLTGERKHQSQFWDVTFLLKNINSICYTIEMTDIINGPDVGETEVLINISMDENAGDIQ